MRLVIFILLAIPVVLNAQTSPPFGQDSTLYRKLNISARYAYRDSSASAEEVKLFNQRGQCILSATLSSKGDTLQRNCYTYDQEGHLLIDDWFYPKHNKTPHLITTYKYDSGRLVYDRTDWIGVPDSKWFSETYTYDYLNRLDHIYMFDHDQDIINPNYDGNDTIAYSYSGDTTIIRSVMYADATIEKSYYQKDISGKILVEQYSKYNSPFFPFQTFGYDRSGFLSRAEFREDGEMYWWENYTNSEKGLLLRKEIFESAISTRKPIAVYTYKYEYYK